MNSRAARIAGCGLLRARGAAARCAVAGSLALLVALSGCARESAPRVPPALTPQQVAETEPWVVDAIRERRAAVLGARDAALAWGRLGLSFEVHDYRGYAAQCYRVAEQLDPRDARWPYSFAACSRMSDQVVAVDALRRAVRIDPLCAPAFVYLGDGLLKLGEIPDAREAYARAWALDETLAAAGIGLAKVARVEGRDEDARRLLEQVLALPPATAEARWLLAAVLDRLGEGEEASHQRRLAEGDRRPEPIPDLERDAMRRAAGASRSWRRRRGRALLAAGRFAEAEAEWEAVLAVDAHDAQALVEIAATRSAQGRRDEALAILREVLARQPDFAAAHFELGLIELRRGDAEAAAHEMEAALVADPSLHRARSNLGALLMRAGRHDEGVALLRQACSQLPVDAEAHFNLAQALARAGDPEEAAAAYDRTVALAPDRPRFRFQRGLFIARQGHLERAVADFRAVLAHDPERLPSHTNLVRALARLGRTASAVQACRRGLRYCPGRRELLFPLAWLLCTSTDPEVRDVAEAAEVVGELRRRSEGATWQLLDLRAAIAAAQGNYERARTLADRARQAVEALPDPNVQSRALRALEVRARCYRRGRPAPPRLGDW